MSSTRSRGFGLAGAQGWSEHPLWSLPSGWLRTLWGLESPALDSQSLSVSTLHHTPKLEDFEQGRDMLFLHIPGDVLVAYCMELPGGPITQLCVLKVKSQVGG